MGGSTYGGLAALYNVNERTLQRHFAECFVPTEFTASEGGQALIYNLKGDLSRLMAYLSYAADDAKSWLFEHSTPDDPDRLFHLDKFSTITARAVDRAFAAAGMKMLADSINVETDKGVKSVQFIIQTAEGVHERDPDTDQ